ncbi:SH3 domain-containing protein [Pseudomonadota bacterium]
MKWSINRFPALALCGLFAILAPQVQAVVLSSDPAQPESVKTPTQVQPQGNLRYKAVVTKNANMRSGPATSDSIVVVIPEGTQVIIAPQVGDWYQTQAIVDGQSVTGWVYSSLIATQMEEIPTAQTEGQNAEPQAGQLDVSYSGYSEKFLVIRKMYNTGELQEISEIYAEQEAEIRTKAKSEEKLRKKIGLLRWLERGTLALDQGAYDDALLDFATSENLIEERQGKSRTGRFFGKVAAQTAGTLSGFEEIGPYNASGWEKVLMLNYKTITYLLQGDRRAYNVTRRAIDWQNIEKKAFDKELAEEEAKLNKKYEKEKKKHDKNLAKAAAKAEKEGSKQKVNNPENPKSAIQDVFARVLKPMDKKASSVASAYVNPFGFYVAGMIQEFESYSDRNLQDNARISYSKALELNPNSKVLEDAVQDMKKTSPPGNINLLHIIVADGFVPEKKVLTYNMPTQLYGVVPLKIQIYDPVDSTVDHIEVHSKSGKYLATLSTIADVEALCLRQQKDLQRAQALKALTSTMVSVFVEHSAQEKSGIAGGLMRLGGKMRQKNAAPDMRSWMSLPASIQASRLHLKKGVDQLKIVSFDKSGKKLASQIVKINPDSHGVVYIRSMNNVMYAQVAGDLWM